MFRKLFGLFRSASPTIRASNVTEKYISNAQVLAKAMGEKLKLHPGASDSKGQTLFILDFHGDQMASRAEYFGEEISSLLTVADPELDAVLIRLNSGGGAAHAYGYAASQIERLKDAGLHVTVSVDRVAASGGYMMACVADKIIAAPYAILGSIGVVAEFPNFSRLLKELGVDYKQYTAGKFKRTVSTFAPISEEGEAEFMSELDEMHVQFKEHVKFFRDGLDIDEIATGKTWTGKKALAVGLIDEVLTSEEFIGRSCTEYSAIKIDFIGERDGLGRMVGTGLATTLSDIISLSLEKFFTNTMMSWK